MDATNPNFDPAELFRKTAEDARRLIPMSEAKISSLRQLLTQEQSTLARLQQLANIDGTKELLVLSPVPTLDPLKLAEALKQTAEAQTPPSLRDLIIRVLMLQGDAGAGMTVQELMTTLKVGNIEAAESTVYSYLGKGKKEGLFNNENSRWSLSDEGTKYALGLDLV